MSPQVHPNGFRISDRPVAASFAHPYSFQPVTDFLSRDEACIPSSLSLGGVEETWVRYWDESATAAVLEFQVDEATQPASNTEKDKDKEKEKKKKIKSKNQSDLAVDWLFNLGEGSTKEGPVAPSALPVSDKPVTLSFSKGPIKLNAGKSIVRVLALVEFSIGLGPVKPALLSMDDGADSALPETTEESAANPLKGILLVCHINTSAEICGTAHQVKKVAPLIASKKVSPRSSSACLLVNHIYGT